MGLFDRIRKAFSSQDDEEKIKQERRRGEQK